MNDDGCFATCPGIFYDEGYLRSGSGSMNKIRVPSGQLSIKCVTAKVNLDPLTSP
jgi:hypothetical protein